FAGIYKRGAGLGPAIAFLYSGPAINILAIILTGRILGIEFGIARAVGAIVFSVVIGLTMQFLFRREEAEKQQAAMAALPPEEGKPLWKTAVPIALMMLILVFANWGKPGSLSVETTAGETIVATRAGETADAVLVKLPDSDSITSIDKSEIESIAYAPSVYTSIYNSRFYIAGFFLLTLIGLMILWYTKEEAREWGGSTWTYAKLILPYLFGGVLIAGFLLGRPGHTALIPPEWISGAVGGNSWASNLVASFAGALMYFATLTELPILQGLMGSGMGDGPALALLLAGPALSLPNMLVIRKILGTKKTLAYVMLVVIAATLTGKFFGVIVG
ncbi:permease, partial [Candidatus Bipolaricaulota bacterium]|nr:permease [Candidatus Bipolaricaulota bacterium]